MREQHPPPDAFRRQVRGWSAANCSPAMRPPASDADIRWGGRKFTFQSDAQRRWREACVARGCTYHADRDARRKGF